MSRSLLVVVAVVAVAFMTVSVVDAQNDIRPLCFGFGGATPRDDLNRQVVQRFKRFEKRVPVCIVFGQDLSAHHAEGVPFQFPDKQCIPEPLLVPNSDAEMCVPAPPPVGNKVVFYPTVDQYTLLELHGSYNHAMLDPFIEDQYNTPELIGSYQYPTLTTYQDMQIQVEVGGQVSARKLRGHVNSDDPTRMDYIVPFYTVIVKLRSGKVVDISWDEGCFGCSGDKALDHEQECKKFGASCKGCDCALDRRTDCEKYDCDLKVYISWIGTDSNGDYLTSAGRRLSQFAEYSVSDVVEDASVNSNRFE